MNTTYSKIPLPSKKEVEYSLDQYRFHLHLEADIHPRRKLEKGKPVYEDPLYSEPVVKLPISSIRVEGDWEVLAHDEAIILSDRYGSRVCLIFPSVMARIKATKIIEMD